MKRRKSKSRKPAARTAPSQPQASTSEPSRRDMLRRVRNWGIGAAVAGGGGWLLIRDVQATMHEHDLTRIGNGVATVVQIHDPQCPVCQALQRESRAAVCEIGSKDLQFLVANIRAEDGRKLAREHNVQHVTLLLLDGTGKRREVLVGPNKRAYLESVFRRHLARFGKG